HEAIPAISWPAMTMDFQVAPNLDLSKVQLGQPVDFRLEKGNGGNYTVTSISPAAK
ncbi:Cu/Ag efflux protein CusF, partial [Skermanella aerolata]